MLANIKEFLLAIITLTVEGAIMHFNLFFKLFVLMLLSPLYFNPEQVALLTDTYGVYMIADTAVTAWIETAFQITLLLVVTFTNLATLCRTKLIHVQSENAVQASNLSPLQLKTATSTIKPVTK
ncbi:hypothetical protein TUM4438_39620 [Shewanella sairae]|uniref:DUF2523 domain-containing protein n=1 Tax=Shewanella sairae TaxID=190310 RepID=A0ABQ4PRG3_9GAMM|nr:hypothetical protein [Shewanella sairae]MCL1132083.1 hypothetical protein [Shewanella sairae]GIU51126.1 hypothetical protein TUM4438_39620 [Shewanella sairae]